MNSFGVVDDFGIPIDEKLVAKDWAVFQKKVTDAYQARPLFENEYIQSWNVLMRHTEKMYTQMLTRITVDFVDENPYKDEKEIADDINKNKRLRVYKGGTSHPVWTADQNLKFRAYHDYFSHVAGSHEFGTKGEIAAYNQHAKIIPPAARLAAFTEIIGQAMVFLSTGSFPTQKICKLHGFDYVNLGKVDDEEYKRNFVKNEEVFHKEDSDIINQDFIRSLELWVEHDTQDRLTSFYSKNPKPINQSPDKTLYKGMLLSAQVLKELKNNGELLPKLGIESWSYNKKTAINLNSFDLRPGEAILVQSRNIPKTERWLYINHELIVLTKASKINNYNEEEVVCKCQPLVLEECEIIEELKEEYIENRLGFIFNQLDQASDLCIKSNQLHHRLITENDYKIMDSNSSQESDIINTWKSHLKHSLPYHRSKSEKIFLRPLSKAKTESSQDLAKIITEVSLPASKAILIQMEVELKKEIHLFFRQRNKDSEGSEFLAWVADPNLKNLVQRGNWVATEVNSYGMLRLRLNGEVRILFNGIIKSEVLYLDSFYIFDDHDYDDAEKQLPKLENRLGFIFNQLDQASDLCIKSNQLHHRLITENDCKIMDFNSSQEFDIINTWKSRSKHSLADRRLKSTSTFLRPLSKARTESSQDLEKIITEGSLPDSKGMLIQVESELKKGIHLFFRQKNKDSEAAEFLNWVSNPNSKDLVQRGSWKNSKGMVRLRLTGVVRILFDATIESEVLYLGSFYIFDDHDYDEAEKQLPKFENVDKDYSETYYTAFLFNCSPDVLHMTHKYLSKQSPENLEEIIGILNNYFKENPFTSFTPLFNTEEWFGEDNETRVLTGEINKKHLLLDLKTKLDRFNEDKFGDYKPHVTTDRDAVNEPVVCYALLKDNEIVKKFESKSWTESVLDKIDKIKNENVDINEDRLEFILKQINQASQLYINSRLTAGNALANNAVQYGTKCDTLGDVWKSHGSKSSRNLSESKSSPRLFSDGLDPCLNSYKHIQISSQVTQSKLLESNMNLKGSPLVSSKLPPLDHLPERDQEIFRNWIKNPNLRNVRAIGNHHRKFLSGPDTIVWFIRLKFYGRNYSDFRGLGLATIGKTNSFIEIVYVKHRNDVNYKEIDKTDNLNASVDNLREMAAGDTSYPYFHVSNHPEQPTIYAGTSRGGRSAVWKVSPSVHKGERVPNDIGIKLYKSEPDISRESTGHTRRVGASIAMNSLLKNSFKDVDWTVNHAMNEIWHNGEEKSEAIEVYDMMPWDSLSENNDSFDIFRGVKDIYLSQVNNRNIADGYWGRGTYYAFYQSDAEDYAVRDMTGEMRQWGIVTEYSFSGKYKELDAGYLLNLDTRNSGVNLPKKFPKDKVFLLIQGDDDYNPPEGGEQLLVTDKAAIEVKPRRFWLYFADDNDAKKFSKKFKLKIGSLNSVGPFKMSQTKEVDVCLKDIYIEEKTESIEVYDMTPWDSVEEEKKEDEVITWNDFLFRGINLNQDRKIKPLTSVRGFYGYGVYFSKTPEEAEIWGSKILKYKPIRKLNLVVDRKTKNGINIKRGDYLENIKDDIDGILFGPGAEGSDQILLKDPSLVKLVTTTEVYDMTPWDADE